MLNRWSLRGTVTWGASLGLAVAFAGLPLQALANAGPGGLLSVNASGSLSADDPRIELTPPPPLPPAPNVHEILVKAAAHQGVDPNLLLAVSFWESGWRVDAVSNEGAIGLLQVMPKTAATAGPILLGRAVNLNDAADNSEIGAALLRDLLNKYDTRTALAAYYQGEPALLSGRYAWDTWRYADGILNLRNQIAAGQGPTAG